MYIVIRHSIYWLIFCVKIWCLISSYLYFGSLMLYRNRFEPKTYRRKSPLKNVHRLNQSWLYKNSRYWIVHCIKFLKSNTLLCFAYIVAPWSRTKILLYLRAFFGGDPVSKNGENSGSLTLLTVDRLNSEQL